MKTRDDTEALNSLTVRAVGDMLGLKLPTSGTTRCPLPDHEDRTASFDIRRGGLRWICYGCNQRGGAIDLVKSCKGMTFLEAKRWLAAQSGLGFSLTERRRHRAIAKHCSRAVVPVAAPKEEEETSPDHTVYAALLKHAHLLPAGAEYLHGRGFQDSTIADFRISQMPSITVIRSLIAEFGFARVEAAGLLTKSSTPDRYRAILPEGALLLPYMEAGRIAYFQARILENGVKEDRWRNLNHRHRRLYNVDVLFNPQIRHVAICEGAMDVIASAQLGRQAIGLIGVSMGLSPKEMIALRGKQVDLLLDWDDAGDRRAADLRKELARFGVAATRKSAPSSGAKDVNDYLREGNSRL
ncbi:toprim domain-containing protein [Acetobacter syzygii]|uniref:toprim domain-containing protein n=1 Tax=Acetobacter syzygii TaxID=146476 RepID=UPI0039ED25C6